MLDTARKVVALLCTITFILSAVLSGTYAWESEQQVLNDLSGTKTKFVSVELLKLEKESDEIFIPDTEFYLFKANGVQVGGKYTTDKDGKISVKLSAGDYYFEEISPTFGYTYDVDENGKRLTKYPFTVTEQDELVTVKAYNIRLKGSLIIQKTVENTDESPLLEMQKKTAFEFTVTFSDLGSYTYKIDDGKEQVLKSGESVKLRSGQSAVFADIPTGIQYTVTEKPVEGYVCTSSGNQGNITENSSVASFVNKCDPEKLGSVIVTKEVQGKEADLDKEFKFKATFGSIVEEFTLKHGESKIFEGIPIGTKYTVIEDESTSIGYVATVKEYTGTILNNEEVTLPFINIHKPISEDKFGSLEISKKVKGENADLEKEFKFKVIFEGENSPKEEVFTLKADQTKVFENIPDGTLYTVTEIDTADYIPVTDIAKGTIVADIISKVEFVNIAPDIPPDKEKTLLTVKKKTSGEIPEAYKNLEFAFTLIVDGEKTEFKLKANESKEFEIPIGATYELCEADYSSKGFSQSILNGYGTAEETPIEITVTNTYKGTPVVEINGVKKWETGDNKDVKLPDSITVRLKNGDIIVEERVVTADNNGKWKYKFTVPKYNTDGTTAHYSIEEEPIENYRTTYDGYDIINTYVAPLKVKLPEIIKEVKGENTPETKFEFMLKGNYGAPMPEDSKGNNKLYELMGAGKLDTGEIIFTKTGEYSYNIYEISGNAEGWKYDTSCYTVTIVVTEKDSILSYEQEITKNNDVADKVIFTNTYDTGLLDEDVVISGEKIWYHGRNPEKSQPEFIIVEVYGNGELVAQRKVTVKDNWKYSFNLPRYDIDKKEITYTISEAPVDNYKKTVKGYNLINTYIEKPTTPTDKPQKPVEPPKTGDNSNLELYFVLMILSLSGLIITILSGKKKIKITKRDVRN